MKPFVAKSAAEQLAEHLRAEIAAGRLRGTMPGVIRLVEKLGVGTKTATGAMEKLERDGVIETRGPRRGSRILGVGDGGVRSLRVKILLFNKNDEISRDSLDLMHHLKSAGHHAEFAENYLWSMGMDPKRVARYVERQPADAWVVIAGSREILEWFAGQPFPSFAMLGGFRGVNIAGAKPDKVPAQRDALRLLVGLGHRRIVKLVLRDRIDPVPGRIEQAFLDELESFGIPTSPYNLSAWSDNPAKFYERLDELFRVTPPTALIVDAVSLFHATRDHLARKGVLAPRDVSLICNDPDPSFEWMQPSVAHIHWSFNSLARRIVRWLDRVASGKDHRRQSLFSTKFIEGGTIGPMSKSQSKPIESPSR